MPRPDASKIRLERLRFAIVASRFNGPVTDALVEGALKSLVDEGVKPENCRVIRVPGAWELIQGLGSVLASDRFDAAVCLGAIIRGETPHFDYLSRSVFTQVARMASTARIPVTMGVLTTDTGEQARARSQPEGRNKGSEAVKAALDMVQILDNDETYANA